MATTYTYSVSLDFPGGAVNIDNLTSEIQTSSIVTALDYIQRDGDVLQIVFKLALSAPDKTTLDGNTSNPAGGLIANHNNETPPATMLSSDIILEAASGRVPGERTITITGYNEFIDDTAFKLLREGPDVLPRVSTPSLLTVVSDDPLELLNGAVAVLVEWLDENWHTRSGVFPLMGTTPVPVYATALRLQKARLAAASSQFKRNSGTLTFMLGAVNAGTIAPGKGQLQRLFWTTPAGQDSRFLGYEVAAHASGNNAIVEVQLIGASPVDSPNCAEAALFQFFTVSGSHGSRNFYVPSIPPKTDVYFTAKSVVPMTNSVTTTMTLYERPLYQ